MGHSARTISTRSKSKKHSTKNRRLQLERAGISDRGLIPQRKGLSPQSPIQPQNKMGGCFRVALAWQGLLLHLHRRNARNSVYRGPVGAKKEKRRLGALSVPPGCHLLVSTRRVARLTGGRKCAGGDSPAGDRRYCCRFGRPCSTVHEMNGRRLFVQPLLLFGRRIFLRSRWTLEDKNSWQKTCRGVDVLVCLFLHPPPTFMQHHNKARGCVLRAAHPAPT